jgi:hypothetical protein
VEEKQGQRRHRGEDPRHPHQQDALLVGVGAQTGESRKLAFIFYDYINYSN